MKILKSVFLTIISFTLINLSYAEARSQVSAMSGDEIRVELEQRKAELDAFLQHPGLEGFNVVSGIEDSSSGGRRTFTLIMPYANRNIERHLIQVVIDNFDHALQYGFIRIGIGLFSADLKKTYGRKTLHLDFSNPEAAFLDMEVAIEKLVETGLDEIVFDSKQEVIWEHIYAILKFGGKFVIAACLISMLVNFLLPSPESIVPDAGPLEAIIIGGFLLFISAIMLWAVHSFLPSVTHGVYDLLLGEP